MKHNKCNCQEGFTLIEVIAVLVIMGILAVVAVPKFFDLQTKAREKAVYAAVSEMKDRVKQHFAKELLEGANFGAISYPEASVGTDIGNDYLVTKWVDGTNDITFTLFYPSSGTGAQSYAQTIIKPQSG